MKPLRWEYILLAVLLLSLFWFRMELSTSIPALSYDSYLTVREVEHIKETGKPLTEDSLSVTGHERVGSPLFGYLLAGLLFFGPLMFKLLPNLLMVLVLLPVYALTRTFTKSITAALLAVVLAATSPVVFGSNLNTPSSTSLALALFFTIIVLLQDPDKYLYWIIGCTLFLAFLSPMVFVLVLALLMIIILLRLERFGVDNRINELFFFTLILSVWFHILVYKRALFTDGIQVLWQNLPAKYAALQFGGITFLDALYGLGVVTFLFGVFGVYHALFEVRMRASLSVIGAIVAVILLLLIRVIEVQLGFVLLSLLLAIMAGHGLLIATRYMMRTKFPWMCYPLALVVLMLFLFTAVLPALSVAETAMQNAPPVEDIAAFSSLRLPRGAVVLTTVREGAAVQYYSGSRTLTDDDFLLLHHGEELIKDIDDVYTARFSIPVAGKAAKLGFTHILFSNDAIRQYNREHLLVDETLYLSSTLVTEHVYLYRVQYSEASR